MAELVPIPWLMPAAALACVAFVVFVAHVAIVRARRRRAERAGLRPPPPAFDLAELSRMVAAGTLTSAEFDRLLAVMAKRREAHPQPPVAGPRGFEVLPPKG
jgi:hypothetical protein